MATTKKNTVINTTETIFGNSSKDDSYIEKIAINEPKVLVNKHNTVKFYCDPAYHALYPNGFESMCQGIHILLIFDGRTVELRDFVADYVKEKIKKKAWAEIDKKTRNATQKQEYLGMDYVS